MRKNPIKLKKKTKLKDWTGKYILPLGLRHVARVGYDYDFRTALITLYEEVLSKDEVPGHALLKSDRSNEAYIDFIYRRHPMFTELWGLIAELKMKVGYNSRHRVEGFKNRLVKDAVYEILRDNLHTGSKRKLFFEPLPRRAFLSCYNEVCPLRVRGSKVVVTGTYIAGSGSSNSYFDECDWEPPMLEDQNRHNLLRCAQSYFRNEFLIPVGDCMLWDECEDWKFKKEVAETLAESA
jgi:hypothetical protein